MTNITKTNLTFAAINPKVTTNKVNADERAVGGIIKWGDYNTYPSYLFDLYNNVPTLKSIIDTCVEYTTGESVKKDGATLISEDELYDVIKEIALSYWTYGGFAINVLRNRLGYVSKLCVMDFRTLRKPCDDGEYMLYSKKYIGDKTNYKDNKVIKIPVFDINNKQQLSSVYYYSNSKYNKYPTPVYTAAITAAELERGIDEFHLNSINNGFVGSVIVNLNNGVPDDNQKQEIEEMFTEKFTGKENAGRVVISFNNDAEHAATIQKIDTEDFSDRYESLEKRAKQSLFTAFRCTPTLCGIPTENNGFSSEQYKEQYQLFYYTVIRNIQKLIIKQLKNILGIGLTIEPFKIDFEQTTNIDDVNTNE